MPASSPFVELQISPPPPPPSTSSLYERRRRRRIRRRIPAQAFQPGIDNAAEIDIDSTTTNTTRSWLERSLFRLLPLLALIYLILAMMIDANSGNSVGISVIVVPPDDDDDGYTTEDSSRRTATTTTTTTMNPDTFYQTGGSYNRKSWFSYLNFYKLYSVLYNNNNKNQKQKRREVVEKMSLKIKTLGNDDDDDDEFIKLHQQKESIANSELITPPHIRHHLPPTRNNTTATSNPNSSDDDYNNNGYKYSIGWTPDQLPNPLRDPKGCNIASQLFPDESSDSDLQSDEQHQQILQKQRLMLCDPDSVLSPSYLSLISKSLRNFTYIFSGGYGESHVAQRLQMKKKHNRKMGDNYEELEVERPKKNWPHIYKSSHIINSARKKRERIHMKNIASEIVSTLENEEKKKKALYFISPSESAQKEEHVSSATSAENKQSSLSSSSTSSATGGIFESDVQPSTTSTSTSTSTMVNEEEIQEEEEGEGSNVVGGDVDVGGVEVGVAPWFPPPVEVAVALVQKMNIAAILRSDAYFSYEDEDDLVNDAAQYFARYLHDSWRNDANAAIRTQAAAEAAAANGSDNASSSSSQQQTTPTLSVMLIFISVQDRVCFISTGTSMSIILPWWRLEHVVSNMKPDLRHGRYGDAILHAISDLSSLLLNGPPSFLDRIKDFVSRFGVVLVFAVFTFVFATWGEQRDRRKRWYVAEVRSKLTKAEKEKARLLQREYHTRVCPICLEEFDLGNNDEKGKGGGGGDLEKGKSTLEGSGGGVDVGNEGGEEQKPLKRVDSYGIPLVGNDGSPLKMLRCGHIFDETCWRCWVSSGQGNPCKCPVCRQDVGGGKGSPSSTPPSSPRQQNNNNNNDDNTESQTRPLFASSLLENYGSVVNPSDESQITVDAQTDDDDNNNHSGRGESRRRRRRRNNNNENEEVVPSRHHRRNNNFMLWPFSLSLHHRSNTIETEEEEEDVEELDFHFYESSEERFLSSSENDRLDISSRSTAATLSSSTAAERQRILFENDNNTNNVGVGGGTATHGTLTGD